MRVLVTGARGQLGRAVVAHAPHGTTVQALGHAELDVSSESAVAAAAAAFHPDIVINAAAFTAVDRAEAEPAQAAKANTDGPRNLANTCAKRGARLLHVSTDFVFDGRQSTPYAPDAPANPLGTYGRTKLAGEQAVLQILGPRALVLRTAWVYAPDGHGFVQSVLGALKKTGVARVVTDQIGTPTSADLLAHALWKAAALAGLHGVHHFTADGSTSRHGFAVTLAQEAEGAGLLAPGWRIEPILTADLPAAAARPAYSVLDCRRTRALLRLAAVPWRDDLRAVVARMPRV